MNDEYINYFNFLKNLKNYPDTGMAPLIEWRFIIDFFGRTFSYLEIEWGVNLDQVLSYNGCKFDEYPDLFRHRRQIAEIVVSEFRSKGNVGNAASSIIAYLRENGFYNTPKEE